jgi:alpha-galactosidase
VLRWRSGGVRLELELELEPAGRPGPVLLRSLRADGDPDGAAAGVPLVEVALVGEGRTGGSANAQHARYATTGRLRYDGHVEGVDRLEVSQLDPATGLRVSTRLECRAGARVLRTSTVLRNTGAAPVRVGFVSTLALSGFADPAGSAFPDGLVVHRAFNAWTAEFRWQRLTLEQAGLVDIGGGPGGTGSSRTCFAVRSAGTWSTGDFLPVGGVEQPRTGRAWVWQVEHNGGWQWQLSDRGGDVYLSAGGPTDAEHQWSVLLPAGGTFETVPVAVAVTGGGLPAGLRELTRYRRLVRRDNDDSRALPVIFNDYMNCLNGDPSTERLLPLIDRAAALGAEYFVIDAGWYADGAGWWETVGEWRPSTTRFPDGGLRAVTDRIRAAGMRPGLWLEPEVVGVHSPVAAELPDAAFFQHDGRRVSDNGRYQLDFRHPAVTARLDAVVDRLIADHHLGYLKFDYNISPGLGTDTGRGAARAAVGDGLLGHNRAYGGWLDGLFARHPGLVVENCASGGMRADNAQLSRLSIHSTSDQTDPVRYVPIAAAAPSAVPPEQSAVWAYPQPDWSPEVNALTVVNALLGRVHLSGRVDLLDPEQLALVADGIAVYKRIRRLIPGAEPHWPLGLPGWYDAWCALALRDVSTGDGLVAVWRRGGAARTRLELPWLAGRRAGPEVLYPAGHPTTLGWDAEGGRLIVELPAAPTARLVRVTAGARPGRPRTTPPRTAPSSS